MSITISPVEVGLVGVKPREWRILTDNTFAEVTTTGFLTEYQNEFQFEDTDYADVYTTDLYTVILQINVSTSGVVSLIPMPATELTGQALTRVNDTNVTLTLGGSPSMALVNAASITAGWTGQLAVGRGGTGLSTVAANSLLYASALDTLAALASANNGVLVTNGSGVPSISTSLPSGLSATNLILTTPTLGVAAATAVTLTKVNGTEASNAVTANGASGVITTSSLTTAAGSSYAITWTNSRITTTSTITLTVQGGTNTRQNIRFSVVPGSGTATLTIYNTEPVNALNGTILIAYNVF